MAAADEFVSRLATGADLPVLREVMDLAIGEGQRSFLTPEQIELSRRVMGLDTQLLRDQTYFVLIHAPTGKVAGCGGWSRRNTMYGGDHTPGREPALLDPKTDAARVRAMYTHPSFVRKGVGRRILVLCEDAARKEGFTRLELAGTLAGEPLYRANGYTEIERIFDAVPLIRMGKTIPPITASAS